MHPEAIAALEQAANLSGRDFVALTDLATDMPPGRVVDRDGPEVFVACGQGVVAVRNLRVSGAPAVPSDVLKPGDRLGEAWSNVI